MKNYDTPKYYKRGEDKQPAKRILELTGTDGLLRTVRIPRNLEIITPPEDFEEKVFKRVVPQLEKYGRQDKKLRINTIITHKGYGASLAYAVTNGIIYWGLRETGNYFACGFFYLQDSEWFESRAACREPFRKRGMYKAVLATLRRDVKRPLVSDSQLSDVNAYIWGRLADVRVDDAAGRFRLPLLKRNPGPGTRTRLRVIRSIARSIIAMEVR